MAIPDFFRNTHTLIDLPFRADHNRATSQLTYLTHSAVISTGFLNPRFARLLFHSRNHFPMHGPRKLSLCAITQVRSVCAVQKSRTMSPQPASILSPVTSHRLRIPFSRQQLVSKAAID
jgi:hypothetical protein